MKEKVSTRAVGGNVIYGGKPGRAYDKIRNGGNKHTLVVVTSSRRVSDSSSSLVHMCCTESGVDIWNPD